MLYRVMSFYVRLGQVSTN